MARGWDFETTVELTYDPYGDGPLADNPEASARGYLRMADEIGRTEAQRRNALEGRS